MNALPALKHESIVRSTSNKTATTNKSAFPKVSGKKKGKVVRLDTSRLARSRRSVERDIPSPAEQERMVLDHRQKANTIARSILRRWHARLDPQEIVSIVDLSLCEAVTRFRRSKGATFVTFMFYHLRGNLIRAVSAAASASFVPLAELELLDHGVDGKTSWSMGANAIDIATSLCSHEHESPDDLLQRKEVAEISRDACSKLDALSREVVYRIYVLEEQLMDIATELGYSRCHISRVKKKALEALECDLTASLDYSSKLEADAIDCHTLSKISRRPRTRRAKLALRDTAAVIGIAA